MNVEEFKTMHHRSAISLGTIVLMLAFVALAASAELQAQSRDEDSFQSFIDSIAATTYAAAWPTATYKKVSIKSTTRVEDGYDVAVRLLGESAFGGELWLDLVLEIRSGGLSDMRVGGHNARLVPPFETIKITGVFLEELLKEYEKNHAHHDPSPARAAPAHPANQAGAVCLKNPTSYKINYSYRWGEEEWQSQSVDAESNRWHWWPYTGSERTSPKFSIRFDDHFDVGYTETSYWLPRATATLPITCEEAMQFEFVVRGRKIDLRSVAD